MAQWLTPLPVNRSSPGTSSFLRFDPVAKMIAPATILPSALVTFQVSPARSSSRHAAQYQFGTSRRRLILHYGAQVITGNSVGMTGKTLNLFDAQQLSAGNVTRKNQRASSNARGRHARSQSRNAASGNNDFELFRQVFAPRPLWKIESRLACNPDGGIALLGVSNNPSRCITRVADLVDQRNAVRLRDRDKKSS